MTKKRIPVLSIVLYVLTGLLALFTIWAAVNAYNYMSQLVAANQLVIRGNEFDILNFYMSNFAQYIVYAAILFTLGWLVQNTSAQADDLEDDEDEDFEEDEIVEPVE
jgi:hypothetical protein